MIKACIFDLDGTILNTIITITHFINETLQKHGILPISDTECKSFIGDGARKLIERALASKGDFDEEFISEILSEYNSSYDRDPYYLTEKYEGMEELLCRLKSRGIKLGVISNKPHSTTVSAVEHFYPEIFSAVMGGRPDIPLKPDPVSSKIMLKCMDVSADEVVYVGDSGVDMTFGRAFGAAFTLGVLWGFRDESELLRCGADRTFADVATLEKFIIEKIS